MTIDDGFLDILFGMIYLGIALDALIQIRVIFPLVWNALAVIIFYVGKKRITIPRLGMVKFGANRNSKRKKLRFFTFLMVIISFIIFILSINGILNNIQLNGYFPYLLIDLFIFIVPIGIIAYYLDFTRLYLIALLGGLGLILTYLFNPFFSSSIENLIIFGIIGGAIILMGLIFLANFLKKHPLLEEIYQERKEKENVLNQNKSSK